MRTARRPSWPGSVLGSFAHCLRKAWQRGAPGSDRKRGGCARCRGTDSSGIVQSDGSAGVPVDRSARGSSACRGACPASDTAPTGSKRPRVGRGICPMPPHPMRVAESLGPGPGSQRPGVARGSHPPGNSRRAGDAPGSRSPTRGRVASHLRPPCDEAGSRSMRSCFTGRDRKWRTVFAELCSAAVATIRIWQAARRSLGAGPETGPADRGPAVPRSAIPSLEPMDLENRNGPGKALVFLFSGFSLRLSGPCFLPSQRDSAPAAVSATLDRTGFTASTCQQPPRPMSSGLTATRADCRRPRRSSGFPASPAPQGEACWARRRRARPASRSGCLSTCREGRRPQGRRMRNPVVLVDGDGSGRGGVGW